jgi:hypothetical protein
MTTTPAFHLRAAAPRDTADLLRLIHALAVYEKLEHLVENTSERLHAHLFGERPVAEAWVAVLGAEDAPGATVGFALCFANYSTFLGKPGLYLEDLFVQPEQRGLGIGKALLRHLAGVAQARGCGRFEWSVLDWNEPSIRFYEAVGATVLPDWRICRVSGPAMVDLAEKGR